MAAIEALIQEILRAPAVESVQRQPLAHPWCYAPAAGSASDSSWEWYDSSYDLQAGLEVTEHHVPAALCAAVFHQSARRQHSTPTRR